VASYALGTARAGFDNSHRGGVGLKALMLFGVLLLVIGLVSFFVPFPRYQHHGVNVGDAHVGITTHHDESVPPALSLILVVAGAGLMIAGRKS
jgi:hypothetical protein